MRALVFTFLLAFLIAILFVTTRVPLAPILFEKETRGPASDIVTSTMQILVKQFGGLFKSKEDIGAIGPLEAVGPECEDCEHGNVSKFINDIQEPVGEICKDAVVGARQLLTLTYGSCEALDKYPFTGYNETRTTEEDVWSYTGVAGYPRKPNCTANSKDTICRNIAFIEKDSCTNSQTKINDCGVMQTHYLNQLEKIPQCELKDSNGNRLDQCTTYVFEDGDDFVHAMEEDGKTCKTRTDDCMSLFYMLSPDKGKPEGAAVQTSRVCGVTQTRADKFSYMIAKPRNPSQAPIIDPFDPNFRNRDEYGNEFIGWSCSEFLSTALALGGLRIEKDLDVNRPLNDKKGEEFYGYNVNDGFKGRGLGRNGCFNNADLSEGGVKSGDLVVFDGHSMIVDSDSAEFMGSHTNVTDKNECGEEKFKFNDIKLATIHSFDTAGGIGPARTDLSEYQQRLFIADLDGLMKSAKAELLKPAFSEGSSNAEKQAARLRAIELETRYDQADFAATTGKFNTAQSALVAEIFELSQRNNPDPYNELSDSMHWLHMRKYMSNTCLLRFCKKPGSGCSEAEVKDANDAIDDTRGKFNIIRHEANIDRDAAEAMGCINPGPLPKLAHEGCYGECEKEINQCPAYTTVD